MKPPKKHVPAVVTTPTTNARTYDEFVKSYKLSEEQEGLFGKQSAEHFIRKTQTLVTAEDELPPKQFSIFCQEVALVEDGSHHKKLRVIGKKYSRFEPFFDRLPKAESTIYKLARLETDEFKRVTESELFGPLMTAAHVDAILGKTLKKKKVNERWKIDPSNLGEKEKVEAYKQLKAMIEQLGLKLTVPETLVEVANNSPTSTSTEFKFEPAA
jgi:hypothetical protein